MKGGLERKKSGNTKEQRNMQGYGKRERWKARHKDDRKGKGRGNNRRNSINLVEKNKHEME